MRAHHDPVDPTMAAALVGSALWGAALLAWAFFAPSYDGESIATSSGGRSSVLIRHMTIVQENGLKVAAIVALPLVATAIVAVALRNRRRRHASGPGPVAIGASALVGVLALLGALTVGPLVIPVCVLLVVACGRAALAVPGTAVTET